MRRVFNLPAHPLFVHAPLVLMPITAVAALLLLLRPSWRRSFSAHYAVASGVLLGATLLAARSGQQLDTALKGLAPVKKHESLANVTRLIVAGLFVLALALAATVRTRQAKPADDLPKRASLDLALAGLVALAATVATIWMVRTGHEGAKAVWSGTFKK